MLHHAVVYEMACGDVEVTLYDIGGSTVLLCDLSPVDSAVIDVLQKAAVRTEERETGVSTILAIYTLYFQ